MTIERKSTGRTGLSRGICNFHFETKEQLMLDALHLLYQEHEQAWRQTIADRSASPGTRLRILLETLLSPPIADHK